MTLAKNQTLDEKAIEIFLKRFGLQVKQERQKKGLTQEELVQLLRGMGISITQGYISLLESGERKEPNFKKVLALTLILEISLDDLISDIKRKV